MHSVQSVCVFPRDILSHTIQIIHVTGILQASEDGVARHVIDGSIHHEREKVPREPGLPNNVTHCMHRLLVACRDSAVFPSVQPFVLTCVLCFVVLHCTVGLQVS